MKYRVTLADTSDPTGQTTIDVVVTPEDGQSAEDAAAQAAADQSDMNEGRYYMPIGISRGDD